MPPSHFICSKPECTFSVTGTCLESIDNPTQKCPHLALPEPSSKPDSHEQFSAKPEAIEKPARRFPSGLEMGLLEATRLMASRYTRLVGVVGQSNAGKTCLFTSLYLQLTNRRLLPKYRFAGSCTLQGFEQRARHLRDWTKGEIPDQIVDHTSSGISRSPSFLHIDIQDENGIRHDLLLPDLPGEWTTKLISDAATVSRFEFLRRSDVLLIVLEAPHFAEPHSRNNALTDARHLLARLTDNIRVSTSIPLVLAITKCDETEGVAPTAIEQVASFVIERGYNVETIPLAAFPKNGASLEPGFGIDALMGQMVAVNRMRGPIGPQRVMHPGRSYFNARGFE